MVRPLCEVLSEVPDPRQSSGQRYPWNVILMLVCGGILCGYGNVNQIALWGQAQSQEFLRAVGFPRGTAPQKSRLYQVLAQVEVERLERLLAGWVETVLQEAGGKAELAGIAVDGKTLRGSKKQGATSVHLLSAVSHQLGLTLYQVGVDEKTNEIPAVQRLLKGLLIEGRVLTLDALLTQRQIAERIVKRNGDYVMAVKGNQERLYQDIELEFRDVSPSNPPAR
jgi:hypothetical protein